MLAVSLSKMMEKRRLRSYVTEKASKRIAKVAFEMALQREASRYGRKDLPRETSVVCIHKSNVLPITDGLFLGSCTEVSKEYPKVKFSQMYVDTAAMNLIEIQNRLMFL